MQGNPDIDVLMIPTSKAIKKHVKDRDAFTEIYNRAYEAVIISMGVKYAQITQLTAERDEWKADAERLADGDLFYNDGFGDVNCIYCGYVEEISGERQHTPDCPITLHRQLVAKYEVTE